MEHRWRAACVRGQETRVPSAVAVMFDHQPDPRDGNCSQLAGRGGRAVRRQEEGWAARSHATRALPVPVQARDCVVAAAFR